jgi:hypothetical protein
LSSNTNNGIGALSDSKLKQIAGRCRETLLSETIVHDVVPYYIAKDESSTVKELLEAAEKEITALGCIENNFKANPVLESNLVNIRELIVKQTTKQGFPLVRRHNDPTKGYVVSYFNIDAYLESEWVRKSLYAFPTALSDVLEGETHEVTFYSEEASFSFDDQLINKEMREASVAEAIASIREHRPDQLKERLLSEDVSRTEKRLIDVYLDHYQYIDNEQLLTLLENFGGGRDVRTLNKLSLSLYYESLPAENTFKHAVQTNLPVDAVFTGKQLLSIWNQIYADTGMQYVLTSAVAAVRLTRIYFKLTRQRENSYLIKSTNPFNIVVINPRMALLPERMQAIIAGNN